MPMTLNSQIKGQAQGVITLTAGQVITVQKDGVPDATYTVTCPAGQTLTVSVNLKANSP